MKYRKAVTVSEAHEIGWQNLQRGQYIDNGATWGRYVGVTESGRSVWVIWQGSHGWGGERQNTFNATCRKHWNVRPRKLSH
jgi:hypothetical protein